MSLRTLALKLVQTHLHRFQGSLDRRLSGMMILQIDTIARVPLQAGHPKPSWWALSST